MKKKYKHMYRAIKKPQIINCDEQIIISIKGAGNPNNNPQFQEDIQALYQLSYAFRMSYRNEPIDNYYTYTVGPLEGFWSTIDNKAYDQNKDKLTYEIFIVQPEFITKEVFKKYQHDLIIKNPHIANIEYKVVNEGLVGQILHIGPYETEEDSIKFLEQELEKNNLMIKQETHHEIYLSDFRKVPVDRLKTLVRYQLKEIKS